MSGLLQRLASGARASAPEIRPLLAPVFATREPLDQGQEVETESVTPRVQATSAHPGPRPDASPREGHGTGVPRLAPPPDAEPAHDVAREVQRPAAAPTPATPPISARAAIPQDPTGPAPTSLRPVPRKAAETPHEITLETAQPVAAPKRAAAPGPTQPSESGRAHERSIAAPRAIPSTPPPARTHRERNTPDGPTSATRGPPAKAADPGEQPATVAAILARPVGTGRPIPPLNPAAPAAAAAVRPRSEPAPPLMAGDFGRPAAKAREHVPRGPARAEPQPRREPDEIQIHIGRIEVIAAAPAPRAAAAQGRPKATPLEEYLRGRDRRAS